MARVNFKVNTDYLHNDANNMMSDIRGIITDITVVNNEINEMGAMWKGEANTALTQNFNEAYAWMTEALNDFVDYADAVADDKTKYNICEAEVTDALRNV